MPHRRQIRAAQGASGLTHDPAQIPGDLAVLTGLDRFVAWAGRKLRRLL